MSDNKEKRFVAKLYKKIYDGDNDFKIYAMDIDSELFPDIQRNTYGNVSISGEMFDLNNGVDYTIIGIETETKYGISYRVKSITGNIPTSQEMVLDFLFGILTRQQATTLYSVYPDIVQRVLNNDEVDLSKTYGIKGKTFEKIKNKIIQNYGMMELIADFRNLLSVSMIRKLYDNYTSSDMVRKRFQENPYECLCNISRVGFLTADEIIGKMVIEIDKDIKMGNKPKIVIDPNIKTSKERCLYCIQYILIKNEESGSAFLPVLDVRDSVMSMCPECSSHLIECVNDDSLYLDRELGGISLKKTYECEKYIAETILNALKISNVYNIDVEEYRNIDGVKLTNEQIRFLRYVCTNNVAILNGCAGTGKSFTISALIKMLDDYGRNYIMLAPTGKAAKVIKEYTHKPASTIHKGLGCKFEGDWLFNEKNKLPYDVIIVDEFSMVNDILCRNLLRAIDFNTTKLIIVGDNAQLPSVSCGNLLHDFIISKAIPNVSLKKVFRYNDGGLMMVATDVRRGVNYMGDNENPVQKYGDDYYFINSPKENIVSNVVDVYTNLLSHGVDRSDITVLSAQRVGEYGCNKLNNELQKVININYNSSNFLKSADRTFYVDDIVIQKRNNYKAQLADGDGEDNIFIANGESGVINSISGDWVYIQFDDGEVVYDKEEMLDVDLGYAMTVHKSQGSSAKYVIFISPESHTFMLNSNLIYVALTRTSRKCYHLGSPRTVKNSLRKMENMSRNTFTKYLLTCES